MCQVNINLLSYKMLLAFCLTVFKHSLLLQPRFASAPSLGLSLLCQHTRTHPRAHTHTIAHRLQWRQEYGV